MKPTSSAASASVKLSTSVRFSDTVDVRFAPSNETDTVELTVADSAAVAPAVDKSVKPPPHQRVLTKAELLAVMERAVGGDTNVSNSAGAAATLSFNNVNSGLLDEQLLTLPKYLQGCSMPPPVDPRGGRGNRITENVRDAAAVAAAAAATTAATASAADRPSFGKLSASRRRLATTERVRSKQSSACGFLLVFLLLILPVTMIIGTVSQISSSSQCRIWLQSPVLLLVIGLCGTVMAVMVPLFIFRLMGVPCLDDLMSVGTIAVVNLLMSAIILVLLVVITGGMVFQTGSPSMSQGCSQFIKNFIIVCVSVLWFLFGATMLIFCCDIVLS